MNDNDELDPDEMIRRMIADMEEDLVEIEMRGSDYDARMAVLLSGAAPKHVDMDTAVKIDEAIFLPELGGVWTESLEFSIPSQTHSVKTLRNAIASGALGVERPHIKKQFLTRNLLKEYRESCRERPNPHISSSATLGNMPSLVKSRTKPSGAFTTDERELTRGMRRNRL